MLCSLREKSFFGTLEGFLTGCLYLPLLVSYLPVGFKMSLVNFTYGARGLDPAAKAQAPLLFVAMLAAAYLFEALVRGGLLRFLAARWNWRRAFWGHLVVLNLVAVPLMWRWAMRMEEMGWGRFFLAENLYQAVWALLFLRTGSLAAPALFHGAFDFFRWVIINDVAGPFETLYFYSAASDDFYWLIVAGASVALAVQIVILRCFGLRVGARDGA
ncbi:MAG: CPBP family intramembrane metalloprotease [Candidatus Omnitrophica bacterium]|nr:CPBP family intramembrane metalloprotease [Candidatus Omnitrophota bacterium]